MSAPHAQAILDGYMTRLERELEGVSPTDRADLLSQVRDHIAEARRLLEDEGDSDLLNILDRLGPPAELASAGLTEECLARRDGTTTQPRAGATRASP